jgi:ketosteroid isomerase-like protein
MGGDAEAIVRAFNNCINRRDLDGLAALMTDDHRLIDPTGNTVSGRQACLKAWDGFFLAFPDYRNNFDQIFARGDGDHCRELNLLRCALGRSGALACERRRRANC